LQKQEKYIHGIGKDVARAKIKRYDSAELQDLSRLYGRYKKQENLRL